MKPQYRLLKMTAVVCATILIPREPPVYGQAGSSPQPSVQLQGALLSPAALDGLVAPIALYPDELLAQTLAAATYPLEVVDANRWLKKNASLKGAALVQAAAKQDWEPSIQALVIFPHVLDRLETNLKWTVALGNAFLAQQEDVMLAIQRMRQKAGAAGALYSNPQQKVEVRQVEGSSVIVIQPVDSQLIYVPLYNPTMVFGSAPVYAPYPVIAYPSASGIIAARAISFAAGIPVGAILGGWHDGVWGWGCSWGRHPSLHVNNTFINRYGFRSLGYSGRPGNAPWAHNPQDRGAVPYTSASVANRYGAGRAVAKPYDGANSLRPSAGAVGGVSGVNRGAAAVTLPRGSARPVDSPNGRASGVDSPRGADTVSSPPNGGAARSAIPVGPAGKTPRGTYTNPQPNPYGGDGAQTRLSSQRGATSMAVARTGSTRPR